MSVTFKARLKQRELLLGPLLTLGSTEVAEMLSRVGFDWLWIDMEHAPIGLAKAQQLLQAAAHRVPCLIRAPANDNVWIKQVLDTGCDGIILPLIKTAAEARSAIEACHYPPAGTRSVGLGRAQGYGMDFADYLATAHQRLAIILQIEHIHAVHEIEAILDLPGFDAVLIGPYDLSASMGLPGQVGHPDVQAAIDKTKAACASRNVPIGIFAIDNQAARTHIASGCTLIGLGADALYLWKSAQQAVQDLRPSA